MFDNFLAAVAMFCHLNVFLSCAVGSIFGFIVGVVPAVGPAVGIALAIPFSLNLNPGVALTFYMGIYCGAEFGGCVTSILMNVPGNASAAATVLDGFPMAKKGQAVTAIAISTVASWFGGVMAPIFLLILMPFLSTIVLYFGTPEFFLLSILGICCISVVSKGDTVKGLMFGAFGLMLTTIGISPLSGDLRYTFGSVNLFDGFDFLTALLGVYGVAEMLSLIQDKEEGIAEGLAVSGSIWEGIVLTFKNWPTLIRASCMGLFLGIIPGFGGTTASFLSWAEAKRSSKHPETFGNGEPAGVVATEASNNSVVGGALMPTLLFGIPGSGSAALILGGLLMLGLNPGRELFRGSGLILTEMLMVGLIVSAFMMLALGLATAPYFSKVTTIRKEVMIPTVFAMSSLGIYVIANSYFDVSLSIVFGILGYFMHKGEFPLFPMVLALILGGMVEDNLLRTLNLGDGSLAFLLTKPLDLVIIIIIVLFFAGPVLKKLWQKIMPKKSVA
jgi:putative tricarboxylic transport membrane protein